MNDHRVRVLVIEGDPDRVQLLEEAFTEMADTHFQRPAYPVCEREYALDWLDGLYRLRTQSPDAVLLNISQDGVAALPAFLALRNAQPGVALILLCSPDDEKLAISLLRQGAQDYLILSEIDCEPLARALRSGIERSRLQVARQSVALIDDLTGLYNDRGLARVAERDLRLSERLGLRPWIVSVRLDDQASDSDRDLFRIDVAELLANLCVNAEVPARVREDSFVVLGIAAPGQDPAAESARAAKAIEEGCAAKGLAVSVATEDPYPSDMSAIEALCENGRVEDRAGRNL